MTETATETGLTPDLLDRLMKLSAADKDRVVGLLTGTDPDEHRRAWREEIGRRLDAVRCGGMKTYSLEETMAYLSTLEPTEDVVAAERAVLKAELSRRWDRIRSGQERTHTIDEVMATLRAQHEARQP